MSASVFARPLPVAAACAGATDGARGGVSEAGAAETGATAGAAAAVGGADGAR